MQINMRTSRTNVDGKRKVKHMIEIAPVEQNQLTIPVRPDNLAPKIRRSRAYSFRQQAKPLLSFDDKEPSNNDNDEIATVRAGSSQQKQSEGSDLEKYPVGVSNKINRSLRVFNPKNKLHSSFNLPHSPKLSDIKKQTSGKEYLLKQLSK